MTKQDEIIEAEASETALATITPGTMTLSAGGTLLPSVDEMAPILAEYDKRKKFFLDWLRDHFVEGVHYGTPKGCDAKDPDSKRWKHKHSLYDSGARLFVDLFGVTLTYESAEEVRAASGQNANSAGAFARRCIVHRKDGEVIGEGTGMFVVGEKKMNENSAIKMADKRARVAAVLDAFPFDREVFTQDLEDMISPQDRLRDQVASERADCEGTLSTDDFLVKVAEACLYGKGTITNNAEAKRISDALTAGEFDWKNGERLKVAAPQGPQEPQAGPSDAPVSDQERDAFRKRIAVKRAKCESSMDNDQFIAQIIENEFGLTCLDLETLDRAQYAKVCASLKAGKFCWDTAERLPE